MVYWCWSTGRDECTPPEKNPWSAPVSGEHNLFIKWQCILTCPIGCGLSKSPVLWDVVCLMLRFLFFFQRALPSLVVTKARNCHRVRQRRCSYRFQVPYARQKEKQIKLVIWVVWVTIPVTECARDVSNGCILHEKGNIKGKEIFGLTYRKWLESTHKRPENKDRSRKLEKKKDPCNPFRVLGRKSVPLFVQHLKVHIYKHNMRPNFTGKLPANTLSDVVHNLYGNWRESQTVGECSQHLDQC